MDEVKLEAIVQNFISIIPLFKKKLLHDNCKFDKGNLNHSHFQILAVLKKEGQQPISEVAKKLFISTPNMTKLLNKLIYDRKDSWRKRPQNYKYKFNRKRK